MTIYKDRSITNDLLSKLEEFEPKDKYEWPLTIETAWDDRPKKLYVHSDNYIKLYDIINNSDVLYNHEDNLLRTHNTLSEIMNRLSKNREFIKINYDRYKHNCVLYGLRLDILRCKLRGESGAQYHHDYFSMRDLPRLGCRYGHIENLTYMKNGTPDYRAESLFGNQHEYKFMTRNIICCTKDQLRLFDRNVNIFTYKRVDSISRINHVGAEFDNHIKFGDMYGAILKNKIHFQHKFGDKLLDNKLMVYQITVDGSEEVARSIIKQRYEREQCYMQ